MIRCHLSHITQKKPFDEAGSFTLLPGHAGSLLQDVSAMQWEITFNQVQFKNLERSWKEKHDRYVSDLLTHCAIKPIEVQL